MWNFSERYTFPLFESVCVLHGTIVNKTYHEQRFQQAYQKYYGRVAPYPLFEGILIPPEYQINKVKLRVTYGKKGKRPHFTSYQKKEHNNLKVVIDNRIKYALKLQDRHVLNVLYQQRGNCDDVLIVKEGYVTDSSYANLVFFDGSEWFTPSTFLLPGTCRRRLLDLGWIKEREIQLEDVKTFKGFQLINALLDFDPDRVIPISGIWH